MFNQSGYAQTVDDISWSIFDRGQFHQTVLAVFGIEMECEPDKKGRTCRTEAYADLLGDSDDIHDDEHHEHGKQSSCEDEQVLRFQAFVLNRPTNALID